MSLYPDYPIFLHLASEPVLIVGGGAVACRKAGGLLEAGARVTVLAPELRGSWPAHDRLEHQAGLFESGILARAPRWKLVFAATDRACVNVQVLQAARQEGILACRCDEGRSGDFQGAASWHGDAVSLAVSTRGASPALGRQICRELSALVEQRWAPYAAAMAHGRAMIQSQVASPQRRQELLRRLAQDLPPNVSGAQLEALISQWISERDD